MEEKEKRKIMWWKKRGKK